ncbi:MAG TPA: ABC transporter substrate-binding protein [Atribacterota bacterium]|nr:ABC transporter substrate-binding protein [Atribacterota bacterium]
MRKLILFVLLVSTILFILNGVFIADICSSEEIPIRVAVEFMDHAAAAYISQAQGWFEEEGLNINYYENYVTGMALAAALGRGDIQAAYLCLIPAINAYANARVAIKIVAGTHKYGYGLVVNTNKIKDIYGLQREGIRIGCVREGGAVDVLLHKAIIEYGLDKEKVLNNVQRMDPAKQLLAIQMDRLDAAFLPEQWATMAEDSKYQMMLMSQDIWPEMQGSVLVVKSELIEKYPELVRKLVKVTEKSTDWIIQNPESAAEVVAHQLSLVGENILPVQVKDADTDKIEFNADVLLKSMSRIDYGTDIDSVTVQDNIDFLVELGYIKNTFDANEILDLRFLSR